MNKPPCRVIRGLGPQDRLLTASGQGEDGTS